MRGEINMTTFQGIDNVIDAAPILGADGIADGFVVHYIEFKTVRFGKKTFEKPVEKTRTVYVREFNPNSVANDGSFHGFGNVTVYKRSTPKVKQPKKKQLSEDFLKIIKVVAKPTKK